MEGELLAGATRAVVEREAALTAKVASLEATVRDLNQRLYGTKSEKSAGPDEWGRVHGGSPRHRGQHPGSKGHGRSERSALLVVPEVHDLSEAPCTARPVVRRLRRFLGPKNPPLLQCRSRPICDASNAAVTQKTCGCPQVPGLVTAPPAPRVIPKSPLGVSVWTTVLLDKYLYGRPTSRFCEQLTQHGLPLSQGTLTDGLQTIAGLFEPVMTKLYERQMREKLFHGDETRWEVFEEVEGKTGHRWSLWVMQSASVVFYRMAPGRGADVPTAHVAKLHQDRVDVVLVCDRYRASTGLAKAGDELMLAFCWAQVRRDFLKAARSWPDRESWLCTWGEDIRALYRRNATRLEVWEETLRLEQQPAAFVERHRALETQLSQRQARLRGTSARARPPPAQAQGPEQPAYPLGRAHRVARSSRSRDGQEYRGADAAQPGGGPQELLRLGQRVERHLAARFQCAANDLAVGPQSASLVDNVLTSLCGAWRHKPDGPQRVLALADGARASGSARSTWAGDVAPLRWSLPRAGGIGSGRYLLKPDPSRHSIQTQTDGPWRDPDAAKGCAQRSPARQGQNLHQVWLELLARSLPTP